MTNRIPVGIFFALFTVSGFAGLIYESIWSHYLKLFLGHAAYAQTLVLAIFMGGMAIGAWLVSRFTHRIRDLLLGYAMAELGIGLLAITFHSIFQGVTGWAFDSVLPALGGSGVDLFKWTLASLLILPASILLGTTFPLMSGGIIRLYPDASGKALSMLYFTNSFGAAAGVLVSGFYLVDKVGLPGTILTAGLMNVALAFVVWVITKRLPDAPVRSGAADAGAAEAGRTLQRAVLILAFATGAASFIYEITWIRMLTLGLGASTHSFEVMLAAFILGMSLGALVLRFGINRVRSLTTWLAGLLVAKAIFAVYAVWIYSDVLDFIYWVTTATARTDGGYTLTTLSGLAASMIVMFPTAFCAGMTLPLATHALTSRGLGEAAIGKVYGANTAGCIVGAAFTTHIGMQALGVKNLTGLGAFLDIAMAALIVLVTVAPALRMRTLAAVGVLAVAAGVAFSTVELDKLKMSSGVFRYGAFVDPKSAEMRYYQDGKTATISVYDVKGLRSIRTNGKPDAAVAITADRRAAADEGTMFLAAALPLAMKPNATDVANIGFGSGLTTHLLLGSPNLKVVDSIEIEPAMIEGAKWFAPRNSRAYQDPRSRIHIEDAKTYFAAAGKKYDFIVSEPSNPWVSGVSTLFSEEFYSQIKRYIKDDGLLVQWIQVYEIDVGLLSTIFQALGKHFPDYVVYSPTQGDLIIIASPSGKIPKLSGQLYSFPGVAEDIGYLGYRDLHDIEALRVGGRAVLEPLFTQTGYAANSDYFPILDQRAPKARFKRATADEIRTLRENEVPLLAMLDGETRTPLSRLESVDRNRPLRLERALTAAEAVGVFATGSAARAVSLSEAMQLKASAAGGMLPDCKGSTQLWLGSVRDVVRVTAPYLDAKDSAILFEKIRASACWKGLDEPGRMRIALYEAVNRRDAEGMSRNANALLALADPLLVPERGYYAMAAMTGHLARGQRQEAAAVWRSHGASMPEEIRGLLITRLALAHAGADQYAPK